MSNLARHTFTPVMDSIAESGGMHKNNIKRVVFRGDTGRENMNVILKNGFQLSVVPDGNQFEIAIYDINEVSKPELFDESERVIDVARGADVKKILHYVRKLGKQL